MHTRLSRQLALCALGIMLLGAPAGAQPPSRDARPLGPAPRADGAPVTPSTDTGFAGAARTAASLGVVLAIIFVGAKVFRKAVSKNPALAASLGAAGRSPAGILEILGRYPVSRGASLVLLRIDRRVLLLSQSTSAAGRGVLRLGSSSLTTLCEITDADDVASILAKARDADAESLTARFESLLESQQHADTPPDDQPAQPDIVVRAASWSTARGGAS